MLEVSSSFIVGININNTKMYITMLILEIPSSVVPNHKRHSQKQHQQS